MHKKTSPKNSPGLKPQEIKRSDSLCLRDCFVATWLKLSGVWALRNGKTAGDGSSFSINFRTCQCVTYVANVKEVTTVNQCFNLWGWHVGVEISTLGNSYGRVVTELRPMPLYLVSFIFFLNHSLLDLCSIRLLARWATRKGSPTLARQGCVSLA